MNKDRRESDYPAELETHFVMRLPEEPAKQLRQVLQSGDNLKSRLTIQIENDMRSGEVRFDHWLMHAKIVDLPAIVESLKTIDSKSFYKCADISQMMICKTEPDITVEEETCSKNKKKDPYKVDKKFLYPHGITPPTKNVRKRRFRKTLKKKCVEAPEIEKEVKRLLRADNEAVSFTWEVIKEEDEQPHKSEQSGTTGKTTKADRKPKVEKVKWEQSQGNSSKEPSNVVDIFGGAVSDSEDEDNINVEMEDIHLSAYDSRLSDTNSMQGAIDFHNPNKDHKAITEFGPDMFKTTSEGATSTSAFTYHGLSSEDIGDYTSHDLSKSENMQERIDQLRMEIEELKQRKQRTQHEITGIENLALRRRFQDILHTLNQDIMYKEMEHQGLLVMQNSEDI